MAAHNLTREIAAETLAMLAAKHGNQQHAADAMGVAVNTFKSRVKRARTLLNQPEPPPAVIQPSPRLPVSADECFALLDNWIGRKRIPFKHPQKWQAKKEQRIVVAGDFHAPFFCPEAVGELVARESNYTDTLIISGDLMDFYSISRFLKYERVTIEQEIAGTDALLAQLSAAFPDILIVSGNHDSQRFEKQLRTLLAPEMMHVIELLTGGNLSVIHMLAKRYPNVRFAPQQAGAHSLSWMTQVGDLLVTHAEKFSRVPGSALRQIDEGLTDFDHVYNLKPWRVLLQAHTHAAGILPWKADRLLGETGCMCVTHGYQMTARMGGRPQRQGWVKLVQHDGHTDVNSVRFHWLNADRRAYAVA
jgi:predicted MPP superfamily phosphohydrolase